MRDPFRVALIGFGGYGRVHIRALQAMEKEGLAALHAIAEINQEAYGEQLALWREKGVHIYTDWREMLAECECDIVAVATPLHLHREMVITALEAGYPVLCEKSAAVTVQDAIAMAQTAAHSGLLCGIDFQLLASDAVGKLKQLIAAGSLGEVKRISGVGLGNRSDQYYQRASWAGKFRIGDKYVLDGPMDNAFAHMLNNMLYIAAPAPGQLAAPVKVRASMYRAQPLAEMEDTAAVWVKTKEGPELLYLATYNNAVNKPHYYRVEGTLGTAVVENNQLVVTKQGRREVLSTQAMNGKTEDIYRNFIRGLTHNETLFSAIDESIKLAKAQNGAYISSGRIHPIPEPYYSRVPIEGDTATVYADIADVFMRCVEQHILPADLAAPWAVDVREVDVTDLEVYQPVSPDQL
ncbi:MAG: Gfo/Idh/MocA family protein [Limnochordia bacterium]